MKWEDLFLNGSLVDLDIGYWKGQRKLLPEDLCLSLGPAGERVFSLGRKRLIPKEKTIGFQRIEHTARRALEEASLPFPLSGARFVPTERVGEIDMGLQALRSEFEDLTRQFAFEYPEIRDQVRPVLLDAAAEIWMSVAKNGVTKEDFEKAFLSRIDAAYPDPRELGRKFRFTWRFFAITAPKNGTLTLESARQAKDRAQVRQELRQRAVASEEAEVRQAITDMAQDLRNQLMGSITYVSERIAKGEKINERSLTSLRKICERVKSLNFLGDASLDEAIADLNASLVGVSAKEVRSTEAVRSQVQTAFTGIASQLQALAEEDVATMAESLKLGQRRFRI